MFLIASLFFSSNNLLGEVVVQKQMCTVQEDNLPAFVAWWESMGFEVLLEVDYLELEMRQ